MFCVCWGFKNLISYLWYCKASLVFISFFWFTAYWSLTLASVSWGLNTVIEQLELHWAFWSWDDTWESLVKAITRTFKSKKPTFTWHLAAHFDLLIWHGPYYLPFFPFKIIIFPFFKRKKKKGLLFIFLQALWNNQGRVFGGAVDLINRYLWPQHELFCRRLSPLLICETHYL